jgi:hypothetical protein
MPGAGIRATASAEIEMDHVTIRNVLADNNREWGIYASFVDDLLIEHSEITGSRLGHGIYVSSKGDRPIIRDNRVWGNFASGIQLNGRFSDGGYGIINGAFISANRIYINGAGGGGGIDMDGVQNSRIENNLLYDNHASGVSFHRTDGGGPSTGNIFINNTVVQPHGAGAALMIHNGAANTTVYNNILVSPSFDFKPLAGVDVSTDSMKGIVSDYNIAGPFTTNGGDSLLTLAEWQALTGQDLHSLTPNSVVATFGRGDLSEWRISPPSLAIDMGTSLLAPAVDLVGVARPQGAHIDVGAFEYTGLTADFDGDGKVDAADLGTWRSRFGMLGYQGDASGDGRADGTDFLLWQRQLGSSERASDAVVPEPATAPFFVTAAAILVCLRRQDA